VRIEPSDVLVWGDAGNSDSFKTLIAHINHERCGNAAMCIGAAQGALEYAVQYMGERRIGDKTLGDFQGLQWKIADMATQIEGARLLLQRAVHMAGPHGTPPALETAMAKTAANLAAKFVCDEAIQLLGGYGFSREYPVERVYRDIRGLCIGAGTVEVQRAQYRVRHPAGAQERERFRAVDRLEHLEVAPSQRAGNLDSQQGLGFDEQDRGTLAAAGKVNDVAHRSVSAPPAAHLGADNAAIDGQFHAGSARDLPR